MFYALLIVATIWVFLGLFFLGLLEDITSDLGAHIFAGIVYVIAWPVIITVKLGRAAGLYFGLIKGR